MINEIDESILKLNEDTENLNDSTLEYNLMINGGIQLRNLQKQ